METRVMIQKLSVCSAMTVVMKKKDCVRKHDGLLGPVRQTLDFREGRLGQRAVPRQLEE